MRRKLRHGHRPDSDDLPHNDWMCKICGEVNSGFDSECQYCDPPEQREDDYHTDWVVDHRKHDR
jgi:hypothetical protein